jgi:hypothetical protein
LAYCSECGVYYSDDRAVCSSCGRNLKQQDQAEAKKTLAANITQEAPSELTASTRLSPENPVAAENQIYNSGTAPDEGKENSDEYFQIHSQLGKGIIKPQQVELAVDGIHFKYDQPSHNFIKTESVKEKPREYRATDLDMAGLKTAADIGMVQGKEEQSIPLVQENMEPAAEVQSLPETMDAREEIPPCEYAPDTLTPEEILSGNESEIILEQATLDFLEPDLAVPKEETFVWEASQSWFKIPLGNIYRLTGSSLIIIGKHDHKLFEVSLASITGVAMHQSRFAKWLGIGDLLLSIPQFSAQEVVLSGIPNPDGIKQMIEELKNQLTIEN